MQLVVMLKIRSALATVLVSVLLFLTIVASVKAQTGELQGFFSAEYGGISVEVEATKEILPGGNMTIVLTVNCTADGVYINYLNASVYGFINGRTQTLISSRTIIHGAPLQFNQANRTEYTVMASTNVWGITYGQLFLSYAIKDLPSTERNPGFPLTSVRNLHLETLESRFGFLNRIYVQLSQSYMNLSQDYDELRINYSQLQGNYSQLQGNVIDFDNTRRVAVILTVTTVFFVATTLYMIMRRPREYW